MRRWIIGAFCAGVALAGDFAAAQIVPALPFQLQNNTVADATQVMANFNQILNNVNTNGAKNGANSDITSLLGLTTPLAPSVGGTSTWNGGTSTGSANAQVVTPVVPSTFSLAAGTRVVFIAGFSNTTATTFTVAGGATKNIYRRTQLGLTSLVGGEIIVGSVIAVTYDGTQYQIERATDLVGMMVDYVSTSPRPEGWAFADGTCIAQTFAPALFTLIGTTWGSCAAGSFAMPDTNGRATVGRDNGSGRLTPQCAGGNTLATGCGSVSATIAQAHLPNVNFNLSVSDTRTWATSNTIFPSGGAQGFAGGAAVGAAAAAQAVVVTGGAIGGTAASGGSGTALPVLDPVIVVVKLIKL